MEEFIKNLFNPISSQVSDLLIHDIEIPSFYIPNWPLEETLNVMIFRKSFYIVGRLPDTKNFTVVEIKKGTKKARKLGTVITLEIQKSGAMCFCFKYNGQHRRIFSDSDNNLSRINALFLFDQFKDELVDEIVLRVKREIFEHNEIIQKVKQAFAPFIPYVVADKLDI